MVMSALPPKADMCGARGYVCYGPKADTRIGQPKAQIPVMWFIAASRMARVRPRCAAYAARLLAFRRARRAHWNCRTTVSYSGALGL